MFFCSFIGVITPLIAGISANLAWFPPPQGAPHRFTDRQDFADRIATLPALTAKHKVIADAQHENAVDCILEKSWDTFLGVVEGGIPSRKLWEISGKKTRECFDGFFVGELFWKKLRGVEGVVAWLLPFFWWVVGYHSCVPFLFNYKSCPVYQNRDMFLGNSFPRWCRIHEINCK